MFRERVERGFGELPATLPLPTGSSSFPSPALPSPDLSISWQIGLSLTFHPISERAKPLSDLIIFHFCLIVHILLLAEKETSSCLGQGRKGIQPFIRLLGQCSVFWGCGLNPQISWRSKANFPGSSSGAMLCFSSGDLHAQLSPM